MVWFKIDDTFSLHPKILDAGNAAVGLWVRAGAWSMQQLTDGFIPRHVAAQLGTTTQARRLVDAGLWVEKPDGYAFHDWTEYQPSRIQIHANRADTETSHRAGATYTNHKRWHLARNTTDPGCPLCRKDQP